MKKLTYFIGIIILIVIAIIYYIVNHNLQIKDNKFSGVITDINYSCHADGMCSVKIDNKWINVESGGEYPPGYKPEPRGQLFGIDFNENDRSKYIGKKAEVFAVLKENNLTIYGNKKYYIRIL